MNSLWKRLSHKVFFIFNTLDYAEKEIALNKLHREKKKHMT